MLTITVPGVEYFNQETSKFLSIGEETLEFEHSLVSVSKWELENHKAFLGPEDKTDSEILSYIQCMCLTPDVDDETFRRIQTSPSLVNTISEYINGKVTATTFRETPNQRPSREVVTAEIIYYWMISMQIPFECQYWHLDRLFTLIKVVSLKNQPAKKMNRKELAEQQRQINAQNRAKFNTRG